MVVSSNIYSLLDGKVNMEMEPFGQCVLSFHKKSYSIDNWKRITTTKNMVSVTTYRKRSTGDSREFFSRF